LENVEAEIDGNINLRPFIGFFILFYHFVYLASTFHKVLKRVKKVSTNSLEITKSPDFYAEFRSMEKTPKCACKQVIKVKK
jgi:hypothetical protein